MPDDGLRRRLRVGGPDCRKGAKLTNIPTARGLWLAITVLTAALIGAVGGLLAWSGGMNPPTAILTGGGAFTGTVLLIITMLRFAVDTDD